MALSLLVANNHAFAMNAIDLDAERLVEADVADVFGLADGREVVEPGFVEEAVTTEGVDREV